MLFLLSKLPLIPIDGFSYQIFIVVAVFALINFLFYVRFTLFVPPSDKSYPSEINWPLVSMIICTRNDLNHLRQNTTSWMDQDYPNFEVIIVNDGSTDDTISFLEKMKVRYSHLRIIFIRPEDKSGQGKKVALTLGIQNAANDFILLTDADCRPVSREWVKTMIWPLMQNTDVVIGFSPLLPGRSIVGYFAALESVFTAMQYGSAGVSGYPYMAVGRNLAYKRSIFKSVDGFEQHLEIASGDDDLFIQSLPNATKISINQDPNGLTLSLAAQNIKAFVNQKTRHISTAGHYHLKTQIILFLFALSHFISIAGIILVAVFYSIHTAVILIVIRWLLISPAWFRWTRFLRMRYLFILFPFFDLLLLLYYIIFATTLFRKKSPW